MGPLELAELAGGSLLEIRLVTEASVNIKGISALVGGNGKISRDGGADGRR
jgi:hypothetical protein